MTSLRPAAALRLADLADAQRHDLERLIDLDPIGNAMPAARLAAARSLAPWRLGAAPIGVYRGPGLDAAAFSGGNLVPIGGDPACWHVLAEHFARRRRECTSIVGPSVAVHALWAELEAAWGPARAVRGSQPLLVRHEADGLPDDGRLRVLGRKEIERYLPASSAMFAEELGIPVEVSAGSAGYRRRAERLLASGRVFGVVADGAVVFKADIGALTPATCQIQGVWVRPDLRGQGLGTQAMAAVLCRALRLAPSVSLYVNDYNTVARRLYERLGMVQAGELATVLF